MSAFSCQIISERVNPLLRRKEIEFTVYHKNAGTPSRYSIREYFSSNFKVPLEQVYVYSIYTRFGCGISRGVVHIYDTNDATEIVPAYIKIRNLKPDDRKKYIEEIIKKKTPKGVKS
jgi:small subunit ribosomal protein S24e